MWVDGIDLKVRLEQTLPAGGRDQNGLQTDRIRTVPLASDQSTAVVPLPRGGDEFKNSELIGRPCGPTTKINKTVVNKLHEIRRPLVLTNRFLCTPGGQVE